MLAAELGFWPQVARRLQLARVALRTWVGGVLALAFPDYKSLAGYLERRTLVRLGRLHIRLHRIRSADATPFLHTHPFAYLSIILRGGYVEQTEAGFATYGRGSFLWRPSTLAHRLEAVQENTLTLFITWKRKDNQWALVRPAVLTATVAWRAHPVGVYVRELYGTRRYCKFEGYWYVACATPHEAWQASKPSIDQTTQPISALNQLQGAQHA